MIALPDRNGDIGMEARLLLAECRDPSSLQYKASDAKQCMQLMDRVLWNRFDYPKLFGAKNHHLIDIIKAPGQFAGFANYPHYDTKIVMRLQSMIDIANNPKDARHERYAGFISSAIDVATAPSLVVDPSPGFLASWRTSGSSSPGPGFMLYKTLLGTDFYYIKHP